MAPPTSSISAFLNENSGARMLVQQATADS
jgi:hypothetical protein